jgi:YegS/Rv2252/BmrU family lipid kinase
MANKASKILINRRILHTSFNSNWPNDFSNYTDVWIFGGDGTLNFFINANPNIYLPITVFNGGTGNDFFSLLYKNNDLKELIEIGLSDNTVLVDAATCNDKIFLNGLGIGFEGAITKDLYGKNKIFGKVTYWVSIIRRLFTYKEQLYEIKVSDETVVGRFLILDVMNGYRAGGGFKIAPGSIPFDGELMLVLVGNLAWYKRLFCIPFIQRGRHLHFPFVSVKNIKEITISSAKLIQAHMDGEIYNDFLFKIKVIPAAFKFKYKKILSED